MKTKFNDISLKIINVFCLDLMYYIWQPYPKGILKNIWKAGFGYDIATNLIYYLLFCGFLLFAVKRLSGFQRKEKKLFDKRDVVTVLLLLATQLCIDLLGLFTTFLGGIGIFISDILSVLSPVLLVYITVAREKVKLLKCKNNSIIKIVCLIILIASIVVAIVCDVRNLEHMNQAKYWIDDYKYTVINADYARSLCLAVIDFIVASALVISLSIIKTDNSEYNDENRTRFVAIPIRICLILTVAVLVTVIKVLLIPHSSITDLCQNGIKSDYTTDKFDISTVSTTIFRAVDRSSSKAVFCKTKCYIKYNNEIIYETAIDGEHYAKSLNVSGNSTIESKTNYDLYTDGNIDVRIYLDRIIAYEKSGEPKVILLDDISKEEKDEILIHYLEHTIEEGRLSVINKSILNYMCLYDYDFAESYINRYANGNFTEEELEQMEFIKSEYIKKCAEELANSFS